MWGSLSCCDGCLVKFVRVHLWEEKNNDLLARCVYEKADFDGPREWTLRFSTRRFISKT